MSLAGRRLRRASGGRPPARAEEARRDHRVEKGLQGRVPQAAVEPDERVRRLGQRAGLVVRACMRATCERHGAGVRRRGASAAASAPARSTSKQASCEQVNEDTVAQR